MALTYIPEHKFGINAHRRPQSIYQLSRERKNCPLWIVDVHRDEVSGKYSAQFKEKTHVTLVENDECTATFFNYEKSIVRFKAYFDNKSSLQDNYTSIKKYDRLMKVDYPWSARRVGMSAFKPNYSVKRKFYQPLENQLKRLVERYKIDTENEILLSAIVSELLVRRAQKVSYDPWESRKNILTAAIYTSEYQAFWSKQQYRIQDLKAKRALGEKEILAREVSSLLAIVRNYDLVFSSLMQSEYLTTLLNQAETGTLSIQHKAYAAAEFSELAVSCMELSINQALGGPYDDDEWFSRHGNNVEYLAAHIFRKHALNFTNFVKREFTKGYPTPELFGLVDDIFNEELALDKDEFNVGGWMGREDEDYTWDP